MSFSGPKHPNLYWAKFFGTNHYYYFHLPISHFHCAKFKTNSYSGSRVMRMPHFWAQNGPFSPNNSIFGKLLISLSSTYYPLSLSKILKNFLQQIQSYEDAQFFGPIWPISPKWEFFSENLFKFLVSFIHTIYMPRITVRYLSISEILTIKEYQNLIDQEQFLVITWEPDFSQACNFRRMLMNHKNLRFTQIPDKTNDMIFFKSPKTLFLCYFWPFLPDGDFFQKIQLCHTLLYVGL